MQKTLIAVIVLAVVGAGLYYMLTSYTPSEKALEELRQEQPVPVATDEQPAGEVRGTIVSVNTEQAMVDGPYLVEVDTGAGVTTIAIPSMGLPLCAAREQIADPYTLTAGQQVIAYGAVGEDGMVIPCESPDHYLQVVEPN